MFLSDASVKRPVAMCCLIIALTFLGINTYRKFALELVPKMDLPFVTILTVYPGATPNDIETDVAKKIEDVVTEVDGLKHVTSTCMDNVCQTLLEFHMEVDVNVVAVDVREKLDSIMSDFPSGTERPIVLKFDVNAKPVITLALAGDLPPDALYDYADTSLQDRISVISGVANVEILGGSEREVHVLLDRKKLAAAGLSSMHIVQAIQEGVFTLPSGRIKTEGSEYGVRFDAEYKSVREIGGLQVAGKDGARRYLQDLGQVVMTSQERRQAAFIDGRPCIGLRVVKKADANTVRVVNEVRAAVERMQTELPGGMELVWVTDDGTFIESSAQGTVQDILVGIALTSMILFLFLRNFRATIIVAVTMPLTVVISLFFIYSIGITLSKVTLMGIGLSVGILVTNSIVVLESVIIHMERGHSAWDAARIGTSDVAIALLGCSATNVVVLLPIGMMSSIVGLVFRPFAYTVLIVNLAALFIAFTLTPILCAALLKRQSGDPDLASLFGKKWDALMEEAGQRLTEFLSMMIRRKMLSALLLFALFLILVHALSLASKLGTDLFPTMDKGEVFIKLEYPTRQGLNRTIERVHEVEAIVKQMPYVQHVFTQIGKVEGILGKASEGVYLAQLLVRYPEKTERPASINEIQDQLRRELSNTPDCIVNVSIPSPTGGEDIPVEMEIAGESLSELEQITLTIRDMMTTELQGFKDVDTSVRQGKPEFRILPNRAVLADMGAPVRGLGLMTRANLEGLIAGIFRSGARTYDIRVKLAEKSGKSQINEFLAPTGRGREVTLDALAAVTEGDSPVQITRVDKRRASKIYAQLAAGIALGSAMSGLDASMDQKGVFPSGYDHAYRGPGEVMNEAIADFVEAGALAVLLTYLALAAILESFTRPLLILATLPLGLIGVIWSLYVTGQSMSMFVLLGMVMLIGIVVNNAILILDRMQTLLNQGREPRVAILQAIQIEFRAVMMVTLAAVLGMLPLAVSTGLGSEVSLGMGIASVGGIAISAPLTLIVIPILFMLFKSSSGEKMESQVPDK
jgi:hydrophobic/amphiphilic exporter-1 (mainly G- bacteria), HAE1 family